MLNMHTFICGSDAEELVEMLVDVELVCKRRADQDVPEDEDGAVDLNMWRGPVLAISQSYCDGLFMAECEFRVGLARVGLVCQWKKFSPKNVCNNEIVELFFCDDSARVTPKTLC